MKTIAQVIVLTTALAVGFTSYIPAAEARPAGTAASAGVDHASASNVPTKVKKAKKHKVKKNKVKKLKKIKKKKVKAAQPDRATHAGKPAHAGRPAASGF